MIQAARLASAKRITAVIPWFPYSRQDRKAKPREPISGRLVADMLQLAGVDRLLTMDLHAGQIQGFFTIPVDHMTAQQLFARHFRDLGLHGDGVVSVAPDAGPREGRRPLRRDARGRLRGHAQDAARARAGRGHRGHGSRTRQGLHRRRRRDDDRRHPIAGARALREHGAREVWVYVTHALLSGEGLDRLAGAEDISGIVVTDTVPIDPRERPDNLTVLTSRRSSPRRSSMSSATTRSPRSSAARTSSSKGNGLGPRLRAGLYPNFVPVVFSGLG